MSAKTYRLPPEMGGGECTIEDARTDLGWPNHWVVRIPSEAVGGWFVLVPKDALTEVLPAEPTDLGWYLARIGESDVVFELQSDGWWNPSNRTFTSSWKQLHEDYPGITLTRLVREPVVEPATLPWGSHGVAVQQTSTDSGPGNHVYVSTKGASHGFAHLAPDTADAMAAALTTAAAKARQT